MSRTSWPALGANHLSLSAPCSSLCFKCITAHQAQSPSTMSSKTSISSLFKFNPGNFSLPAKRDISALLLTQHLQNPVLVMQRAEQGSSSTQNPWDHSPRDLIFQDPSSPWDAEGSQGCFFLLCNLFLFFTSLFYFMGDVFGY